jgi:hypothetical protein
MSSSCWLFRSGTAAVLAVGAASLLASPAVWAQAGTGAARSTPQAVSAQWTPKELRFVYQGFTTHYSCDGLRDKVRRALLDLGARSDLTVRQSGCSGAAGRPDPFPAVRIKMQVLKASDPAVAPPADQQPVAAHWQKIDLKLNRDALAESGDCELLEQIKQSLLPLFAARNVEYSSNCVPHQLSPGGTRLSAEVLMADAPVAPAAKPKQ